MVRDEGSASTTATSEDAAYIPRFRVVQRLLRLFDSPAYLEIGVSKGVTFHRIKAPRKVAVDPAFAFDWRARQSASTDTTYHECTSDTYFGSVIDPDERFDVIFLDGLHTYEQTLRDLLNALAHLSPRGVVVIDDCRPPTYHASLPDHRRSIAVRTHVGGDTLDWMGDVYRLLWFIDSFCQQLSFRTITDNHGMAVVWRERRPDVTQRLVRETGEIQFEDLVASEDVLNLGAFREVLRDLRGVVGDKASAEPPR